MSKKFLSGINVTGTATLNTVANAGLDTDKFLVLDAAGNVDFRTGDELKADIGADVVSRIEHEVKLGEAMTIGTPVYVGVDLNAGTNMTVYKATNATEAGSSKTLGLIASSGITNDLVEVVTEGLLAGLNTSTATKGDPVWLGVNGALLFGLANKPVAPAHMVFLGIVTRVQSNNGEIFVKVQNGFEMNEIHNYLQGSVQNNEVIVYESATSLYKPKSIPTILGYTPVPDSRTITINGTTYDLSENRAWTITTDASARSILRYVATANQTTFTISGGYTPGLTDVYRNGIKLDNSTDFTATNGTTIVLTNGTSVNDVIEVYRYQTAFLANNALRVITEFVATAGQTTFNVTYNSGLVDVFYNGSKLVSTEYTAGNGTSIVLNFPCNANDTLEVHAYSYQVGAFVGQSQLNGTGFVKVSGTTVTYDNTSYLPLSGGTLTGTLNGTSATFSDTIISTKTSGRFFGNDSYGTSFGWLSMYGTTQGIQLGFEGTTGGQLIAGASANYGILVGKAGLAISANNGGTNHLNITSTGIATFSSVVNSSRFTSTTGDGVFFNAATGGSQWQLGSDSSAGSGMYLYNTGGAGYVFRLTATGAASFTNSVSATNSILVTSSAVAELRVVGYGYGSTYNTTLRSVSGSTGVLQFGNNADNYILAGNTGAGGYLRFRVNCTSESITSGVEAMRINSGANVEKYIPSIDTYSEMQHAIVASGGNTTATITTNGATYKIHTFTSTGTFTVYGYGLVEVLVVAGGGGGGWDVGGGGGAGGYVETSTFVKPGTYTITIGGGGGGATDNASAIGPNAAGGGQSTALGFIALGGGGGGNYAGGVGGSGANGGGGAGYAGGFLAGGTGTFRQGNNGGNGRADLYASGATGGGGGGAAGPGAQSSNDISGYALGGAGVVSWISGSNATYCKGGAGGGDNWGGHQNGASNSGNGGDGAGNPNTGKNGGSGIVIIRYKV